jgi:hypothetical protein
MRTTLREAPLLRIAVGAGGVASTSPAAPRCRLARRQGCSPTSASRRRISVDFQMSAYAARIPRFHRIAYSFNRPNRATVR